MDQSFGLAGCADGVAALEVEGVHGWVGSLVVVPGLQTVAYQEIVLGDLGTVDDQEIVLADLKMVVAVQRIVHGRGIVRGVLEMTVAVQGIDLGQGIVRDDQETVGDLSIVHGLGIVVADLMIGDDR